MNITYSFFPKMFASMSPAELANFTREAGLDTVNAVVREGYWIRPNNVSEDASRFATALRDEGISVHFATTCWNPTELVERSDAVEILSSLREAGITDVRLTQFFSGGAYGRTGDVIHELAAAAEAFAKAAELARKTKVRLIYQVHHLTLISSASALHPLIRDLDPEHIAVMLDGGNQQMEGYEKWLKSSRLFGRRLAAFGVKDVEWSRSATVQPEDPTKGWSRTFVPVYAGVTNWVDVLASLADIDFVGTFVFMPFYRIEDPAELLPVLRREVEYVRSLEQGSRP